MNVLWFEVTTPSRYKDNGLVIGGWQDSLESIVRTCSDINLTIAFEGNGQSCEKKIIDGVEYIPMVPQYSFIDKIRSRWSWEVYAEKMEVEMQAVVDKIKPDIIHVFGTEWMYGRISKFTNIPVVLHIMGSIIPYNNASYPPSYGFWNKIQTYWWSPKRIIKGVFAEIKQNSWSISERQVWDNVRYYMGRTEWDKNLSMIMHPGRKYFHVDEALRADFIDTEIEWNPISDDKIRLISTGCTTFWKGPDMMLKTAKILKSLGVNFEWIVAGKMFDVCKNAVERKEHTTFKENNVELVGFINPSELSKLLCKSTLYVHTAYIENSPNSICEAQCLGVPIVSTNVGGISSLVENGRHGILVPSNDPWQMAASIIKLANDKELMKKYSIASKLCAKERHNQYKIKEQLLSCYNAILSDV